jgi:hypothetical protein
MQFLHEFESKLIHPRHGERERGEMRRGPPRRLTECLVGNLAASETAQDIHLAERRVIRTEVLRHEKTGLLMVRSNDLPGLIVHGRTQTEIMERVPSLIKELLEADGVRVLSVVAGQDAVDGFKVIDPVSFTANTYLEAAEPETRK